MRWILASERLPNGHALDYSWRLAHNKKKINPAIHIIDGTLFHDYGNLKTRYSFDEIEWLDESPAPLPASVEEEAEKLYPYDASLELNSNASGVDRELTDMQRAAYLTAARRYQKEIGALREGVEILTELCALKKYKDSVGKDSHYEQEQPKTWKRANDFLNSLLKK